MTTDDLKPVASTKKPTKTTAVIKIGEEDVVVNKLKAGKFYELQKTFSEIIAAVASASTNQTADANKVNFTGMFVTYPDKVADFVSQCISWDKKDLLEKAYPEEINKAFEVCLELNNITENVKNSVAPMNKVGAIS